MRLEVESVGFQSVPLRMPFMFGASTVAELTTAYVRLCLKDRLRTASGRGAMTLGNAWAFPGVAYDLSLKAMQDVVTRIGHAINGAELPNDPFEAAWELRLCAALQARETGCSLFSRAEALPALCLLVSSSAFDIALFDAWGRLACLNTFERLIQEKPGRVLLQRLAASCNDCSPARAITPTPADKLDVYHTVGGLDPLSPGETGSNPGDGCPHDVQSWIEHEGVWRFKLKLRGVDVEWDFQRIVSVDAACRSLVRSRCAKEPVYSLDMNEQCTSPALLQELLERLACEAPDVFAQIEYVEQPTARDAVHEDGALAGAARMKPIMLDEGLTDFDALERALTAGYSGVCLKACKGIGFSILVAETIRAKGLHVCAQDLTCMGEAFLASAQLASWCGMSSLEANARQYCPGAHAEAARTHPGAFLVRHGAVDLAGLRGPGLGF